MRHDSTKYLAALASLGLTKASQRTAEALGLTVRHCQRLAAGACPIPKTVTKLLALLQQRARHASNSTLQTPADHRPEDAA